MNLRLLGGALAVLLLASCATTNVRVDDLGKIAKSDKAFVVLHIDNKAKKFFSEDPMPVWVYLLEGFNEQLKYVVLEQDKRNSLVVYDVKPGTYRIEDFIVSADTVMGRGREYSFRLDPAFYTYFTVREGEVAYLGSYIVDLDKDKLPKVTTDLDIQPVQDAATAKNPLFEGYRWFSIGDNRQSFF